MDLIDPEGLVKHRSLESEAKRSFFDVLDFIDPPLYHTGVWIM